MPRSRVSSPAEGGTIAVDGVAVNLQSRRAEPPATPAVEPAAALRERLARHLGLSAASLTGLADADVATALHRIRGLVDHLAELEARAVQDDLTGVLRRRPGLDALRLELARARRTRQPLSVAFVDVDGLKAVNDTHGHAAGDALLCTVAATMRHRLRSTDVIMRHGGDEFVCVLAGAPAAAARAVMDDVAAAVVAATGGIGISVGVASADNPAPAGARGISDATTLLAAADLDLYGRRSDRRRRAATPH